MFVYAKLAFYLDEILKSERFLTFSLLFLRISLSSELEANKVSNFSETICSAIFESTN